MRLGKSIYPIKLTLYNSDRGTPNDIRSTAHDNENLEGDGPVQNSPTNQNSSVPVQIVTHMPPLLGTSLRKPYTGNSENTCEIMPGQSLPCGLGLAHNCQFVMGLSNRDIKLWTQATIALRQEPDVYRIGHELPLLPTGDLQEKSNNLQPRSFLSTKLQGVFNNDDGGDIIFDFSSILFLIVIAGLSTIYGAIHLAAWNFNFPSPQEQIIWRISCIIIASGIPIIVLAFVVLVVFIEVVENHILRGMDCGIFFPIYMVMLLGLLYSGARLFIIVESFISIRKLPLGVFVTIDWAKYIPHL